MADRELLELAAKAAGIKVLQRGDGYWTIEVYERGMRGWNPLIDDGDALRLAVRLNLSILRPVSGDSPEHYGTYAMLPDQSDFGKVRDEGDPYAATRRAVVRAAAEIGRSMP